MSTPPLDDYVSVPLEIVENLVILNPKRYAELLQAESALRQAQARETQLRTVLEQIANRPDAEMERAKTLHWDMRGWARAVLAAPEPQDTP